MVKTDSLKNTLGENTKITALISEREKIQADTAAKKAGFAGRMRQFKTTKDKMALEITKAWAVLKNDSFQEKKEIESEAKAELDKIRNEYNKKNKSFDRKISEAKRQVTLKTTHAESSLTDELNKIKKLESDIGMTKRVVIALYKNIEKTLPETSKVRTLSDADLSDQVDKHFAQIFQELIEKAGYEITADSKSKVEALSGEVERVTLEVSKEKENLQREEDKAIMHLQNIFDAKKSELSKYQDQKKKQIGIMQKEYEDYIENETKVIEKLKASLEKDIELNNEKIEKINLKIKKYQ